MSAKNPFSYNKLFKYNMGLRKVELEQHQIINKFDERNYHSEKLLINSSDEKTQIPTTILYNRQQRNS